MTLKAIKAMKGDISPGGYERKYCSLDQRLVLWPVDCCICSEMTVTVKEHGRRTGLGSSVT